MQVNIEPGWKQRLSEEFEKPYFRLLVNKVRDAYEQHDIWPKGSNIFNAFDKCPFDQVKVVILGQDPYPTPGHAHGLCFSVPANVRPIPKSLINIFKEIQQDIGTPFPADGNLERWAEQGVLLLNATLTVQAHAANSHKDFGWEKFTDEVIHIISRDKQGVVFLLWGAHAIQKTKLIDAKKHTILTSVHPSPLSAHRGFLGCKHFSKTNEILISQHQKPIIW
ncbi:MAG: uracil-DNA glycosylase [Crocinitomicaceae bacterium]|nr:uracil-DNA glycosylase [Crocinitomicaceae bacterium]MBK8925539.1 uracil-DNA glycosylase [Crocinitomicaceae bacterium]